MKNDKVVLSDRLKAVMNMVTPGLCVADVGCDHGFLSIALIQNNIASDVIACDVNKGPIESCKENLYLYNLADRVSVRLGDGLKVIEKGEVQSVVIAGMGGRLMEKIISDSMDVLCEVRELILQPQSEIAALRRFLQENGYQIISENMVCEDDKFYPILKVIHGNMNWDSEVFFRYGKILLREENAVLHEFLIKERDYLQNLHAELVAYGDFKGAQNRLPEVENHILVNKEARMLMERPGLFENERVLN